MALVTPRATIRLCTLLLAATSVAIAQPRPTADPAVERELERLRAGVIDDDGELDIALEELLWLRDHPIDLRTAEAEDIAVLPGIDQQIAIAIITVVRHMQPRDMRALRSLVSLNDRQALMLRGFTTLDDGDRGRGARGSVRIRLERETSQRRGHRESLDRVVHDTVHGVVDTISIGSPYRGAPEALLAQLTVQQRGITMAATLQSDRGEPLVHHDTTELRYVRDEKVETPFAAGSVRTRFTSFASASLAWQSGPLSLVLGDFTAEFGQGLAISDARRRYSRSAGVSAPYVNARRIAPYKSSDEASFLRGAAMEITIERPLPFRARGSAFVSTRWLDGTIDSALDEGGAVVPVISSVRADGYRRTISEIRRSSNVLENLAGLNLAVEQERWSMGASWLRARRRAGRDGAAEETTAWSLDARAGTRAITCYAEIAGDGGTIAGVGGTFARIGSSSLVVAVRSIPHGLLLQHGRAFPGGAITSAEQGIFAALELPIGNVHSAIALDLYRRPTPRALIPSPHDGSDLRLSARWEPSEAIVVDTRIEHARSAMGVALVDANGRVHRGLADVERVRANVQLALDLDPLPIGLRVRLDAKRVIVGDSLAAQGCLSATDLRVRIGRVWSVRAGIAVFDVDGADAALALSEPDVPGRIRSVMASGIGARISASVVWRPDEDVSLSFAYGVSEMGDRRTIGSGLDENQDSSSGAVTVQLDWRFGRDQAQR